MNNEAKLKEPITQEQAMMPAERFILRPLKRSDAGLLGMYLGDGRVAEMTRVIPHPLPPEYVTNLIERSTLIDRIEDFWAIDGSASGHAEVMGVIKMARLDRNQSELRYFQDNPSSARVLTNAGFTYLGDAETFCVARNKVIQTWTYVRKMGSTA